MSLRSVSETFLGINLMIMLVSNLAFVPCGMRLSEAVL